MLVSIGKYSNSSFSKIQCKCYCYSFGSIMPGREYTAQSVAGYRFGFNWKERDDEVYGDGNCIAFEARIYDSRLGRFFSIDPLELDYPWQSTYCFAANNPIALIDFLGMGPDDKKTEDPKVVKKGEGPKSFAVRNHRTLNQIASANPTVFRNYPKEGTEEEKNNYWKTNEKLQDGKPKFMINPGQVLAIGPSETNNENTDEPEENKYTTQPIISKYDPLIMEPLESGFNPLIGMAVKAIFKEAAKKALPALDVTRKVHGVLPKVADLSKYSKGELKILHQELKESVQTRIRLNSKLGPKGNHGARQGAEQDLIKSIEKYLGL